MIITVLGRRAAAHLVHCITSSAIGVVLEAEFGDGAIPTVTLTSPSAPGVVRQWTSVRQYVDEVSAARIFGGIHYRTIEHPPTSVSRWVAGSARWSSPSC